MNKRFVIGLDIGTSGAKGVLIDEFGAVVSAASSDYPLSTPLPSWVEQNPEDWWNATINICKKLSATEGVASGDIVGIGISGQMHSLVALDANKNVLRPSILWSDTRTEAECVWLKKNIGIENLKKFVANPALEGFTLPKLLWTRNHEGKIFDRIAHILLPKDYIRFRLTGELATDVSDAAGTLMFDVRQRRWSDEMLKRCSISPELLPHVYESTAVAGAVSREAAAATGLPERTPVVAGGADNGCGAIGAGVTEKGRAFASIGTSGVVFAHSDKPVVDDQLRAHTFCSCVPLKWYAMGVMLMAGGALRWYRDTFCMLEVNSAKAHGIDPYDLLSAAARTIPAGSEGLFFQPYLAGERTPHQSASARAAFVGATIRHTKDHFTRAVFEGITFGMKDSLEIIRSMGIGVNEIRLSGGGAKSKFWRQLQADIYGVEVMTVNTREGPAFGAALLAAVGTGIYASIAEAVGQTVRIDDRISPNPDNAKKYTDFYQVYKEIYPALEVVETKIHAMNKG
ncbi:MAG TPA: xylulokinase [Bacteroidota bacterium]|nr:xylulokinase [Bacteroidota bacterium]